MSETLLLQSDQMRVVRRGEVRCKGVRVYHPALELYQGVAVHVRIDAAGRRIDVLDAEGASICATEG